MPSQFTAEDVERLASLSHLDLTADETALYTRQLAEFLAYAEALQKVDTSNVPPTAHASATAPALRSDAIVASLSRDLALAQAPDASIEAGLFKVPRVIG